MGDKQQYVCPLCGGQLERFSYYQHTWFTKISKSGKLTKQSRKLNNGPIDCHGISCTTPKCGFFKTDNEIFEMVNDGDSSVKYLDDLIKNNFISGDND